MTMVQCAFFPRILNSERETKKMIHNSQKQIRTKFHCFGSREKSVNSLSSVPPSWVLWRAPAMMKPVGFPADPHQQNTWFIGMFTHSILGRVDFGSKAALANHVPIETNYMLLLFIHLFFPFCTLSSQSIESTLWFSTALRNPSAFHYVPQEKNTIPCVVCS